MTDRYQQFISQVAKESIEYAGQYNCTLIEAINDWEGNGPEGGFGLLRSEHRDVCRHLRIDSGSGEPLDEDGSE